MRRIARRSSPSGRALFLRAFASGYRAASGPRLLRLRASLLRTLLCAVLSILSAEVVQTATAPFAAPSATLHPSSTATCAMPSVDVPTNALFPISLASAFIPDVPATMPAPVSAATCSAADYLNGTWVYEQDEAATLRRTGLNMTYVIEHSQTSKARGIQGPKWSVPGRQSWRWEWQSAAPGCAGAAALPPFDGRRLCSALGSRSILFAGDSVSINMVAALRLQMEVGSMGVARPCHNPLNHMADHNHHVMGGAACPSGARIDFITNVHLTLNMQTDGSGDCCPDCVAPGPCTPCTLPKRATCFSWASRLASYDVLVLNSGAHIVPAAAFRYQTALTVEHLRRHYRGRVFYRTMTAMHIDCWQHNRPLTAAEYGRSQLNESTYQPHAYSWEMVPVYNDIARLHYATLPGAVILDVDVMTRLRPDAHPSSIDCLHYTIPGVPDYWSLFLYYHLVGAFATARGSS